MKEVDLIVALCEKMRSNETDIIFRVKGEIDRDGDNKLLGVPGRYIVGDEDESLFVFPVKPLYESAMLNIPRKDILKAEQILSKKHSKTSPRGEVV